ncbi:fibronectin type III domain-containing protein [Paenibacillus cymbidii]|uniref:fibronectin type III domain-containing protein n=1 Tax=Paenibacillus cymbidii TaxID=1639034 RepID=UPI001081678A|nr:fibronectin type III domain-containing protein [Paenibacillus cymbidii]
MRKRMTGNKGTTWLTVIMLAVTMLAANLAPGGRSYADPDTTAPAAVTNLTADQDDNDSDPGTCDFWHCSSTSLKLSWTAPGDDGSAGTATSYEIRYSTATITSANWASATPVATVPVPTAAGTTQIKIVRGLTPNTTYYFALKATDDAGNVSGLSNVGSKKTNVAWGLTLDASKLIAEAGGGVLTKLIDGDTATTWDPASYPAAMNVNYGYTYGTIRSINQIKAYTTGGTGTLSVYVGRPGAWSLLYTDTLTGTAGWLTHTVNVLGADYRFVLSSPSGDAKLGEIQFVGAGAGPDNTPPGAVTSLAATAQSSSAIGLTWTAPGNDDDPAGFASSYDVRYSTAPITEANWASATQATGEPTPGEAGTSQSLTVSGLTAGTTYYFAIKSSDLNYTSPTVTYANTSAISNVASAATTSLGDTTAPAAVTNLAAGGATTSSIQLTWTAPGDDGATGTAAAYDIRYSTATITGGNWASATQVGGEPAPAAAGTSQSMTVSGLASGTTYYFAMKTRDEVSNESGLSNVASAATTTTDTTAPATVANLTVDNDDNDSNPATCDYWLCSAVSLKLSWTAPGDDGNSGTATSYEIRYSTATITSANWASATPVATVPVPTAAGTTQSKIVRGLSPNTTYYFALKATDDAGNVSALSNVGSKATNVAWGATLDASKLVSEAGGGDLTKLIDGNTATTWDPAGYPAAMNVNFGYTYGTTRSINQIKAYTTGGTGTLAVYAGRPGEWSLLYTDTLTGTAGWLTHTVNLLASDVRFVLTSPAGNAKLAEIQFTAAGAPADTTAPGAVTNLAVTSTSNSSIAISWTAPGDDDDPFGYASSYDVRYSLSPITEANWAAATQATGEPTPTEAGTSQSMTVTGLSPGTTYYVAMKASDLNYTSPTSTYANTSLLSNVVSAATTGTPDTTAPAAVANLAASNATTVSAKLTWTAPGDDGNTGTATSYDIRYSSSTITSGNWASATQVTGEPAPAAAGASQNMTVSGLSPSTTYYFAMKTSDEVGNTSALSNVATLTTLTGTNGVFGKIPLDPSMALSETGQGQPGLLLDEQTLAGDPLGGTGGTPINAWYPGGGFSYGIPSAAIINLGQDYEIDNIFVYDKFGGPAGVNFTVSAGSPFNWTQLFQDPMLASPGNSWTNHAVSVPSTHYLRVEITNGNIYVPEIVVYGKSLGTNIDVVPSPVPQTLPAMDKLIGVNALITNSTTKMQAVGNVREYHNWFWDEGDAYDGSPISYPGYPNNQNKFNPSWAGGGWNFDAYYQTLHNAGVDVHPAIQGSVQWLNGAGKKPLASGANPLLPASYAAHADHMFQSVARYGSTAVADNKLKLASGQTRSTGLGYMSYFENGNEDDANWGSVDSYFTPYQFAAMSSADYDGDQGRMGNTFGVKNADPNAKLVMAGLSNPDVNYIKAMKVWSDYYRGGSFPADVLNVHIYSYGPSGAGISPEAAGLKAQLETFVDYRNRYLQGKEIWLSEFGYDTNQGSVLHAPPIGTFSVNEVQGQWIVRSYLAAAAAGVDRAQLFMFSDTDPNSTTKFDTSGLVSTIPSGEVPKTSYYYVYTLKNTLAGMRYVGEQSSGNGNVTIYKFKSTTGSGGAYVLWAPTSNQTSVSNYQLTLAGSPTTASLVQMADGDTDGVTSSLTIASGKVTVNVGERPIFVKVDNMP